MGLPDTCPGCKPASAVVPAALAADGLLSCLLSCRRCAACWQHVRQHQPRAGRSRVTRTTAGACGTCSCWNEQPVHSPAAAWSGLTLPCSGSALAAGPCQGPSQYAAALAPWVGCWAAALASCLPVQMVACSKREGIVHGSLVSPTAGQTSVAVQQACVQHVLQCRGEGHVHHVQCVGQACLHG